MSRAPPRLHSFDATLAALPSLSLIHQFIPFLRKLITDKAESAPVEVATVVPVA
jgi:hypothetical protein